MRVKFSILLLLAFLLSGCGVAQAEIGHRLEVSSYSEQTVEAGQIEKLEVTCDSSNIEVYVWNRDSVKFEITRRIRGAYKKEMLLKMLDAFKTDIENENTSLFIDTKYNGNRKKTLDTSADLKIYIPKKIEYMNYKVDRGSIRLFDDMRGVLNADLGDTDMEINRFDGVLNVTGNAGDVKVSSGRLSGSSSIYRLDGNINVKTEFDETGEYNFSTRKGCINICAPSHSNVGFDTVGKLEINEFDELDYASKVHINSEMGSISVKKY